MKNKYILILFFILLINTITAQVISTEDFETETNNATSFTDNGQVFNITRILPSSANLNIQGNYPGTGWNGTSADGKYIDNNSSALNGVNVSFKITSAGSTPFRIVDLWMLLADNFPNVNVVGGLNIVGKLGGVTKFTANSTAGFNNTSSVTTNGFTRIDFATFGGANNTTINIDELVLTTTGAFNYISLDAFKWSTTPAVNAAPTNIALSASAINENVVANSTVGALSTTDPDAGNTFTYTLVAGAGDTDNASFNISGSSLRIAASPDFETKNSYSVRVRTTDQGSLTYEKVFTITINNVCEVVATTSQTNVSCNGGSNGTASVTPSGGATPYTYSWSPSGGTAATATGLSAGNYTCTITDNLSCQIIKTFNLIQPTALTSSISSQTNVSCNGGSNGTATVVASGGVGIYSYSWSPSGGTSATITGRTAGTYTCTITDMNICQKTQSVIITQPAVVPTPTISAGGPTTFCAGGSVILTSSAATGNIWYNGATAVGTTPSITVTTSGTYTVVVTSGGCTSAASAGTTVTVNASLSASPGNVDITWTGAISTDWNNACNWSPAWVPDATNANVIINNGTYQPTITTTVATVKAIKISNRQLTISATGVLNVIGNGLSNNGIEISTNATVYNLGTINIETATHTPTMASIYLKNGGCTLVNHGAILIRTTDYAGIGVGFTAGASIYNYANGTITIENGGGIQVALASDVLNFENIGTINYNGALFGLSLQGTTTFNNSGSININSGTGIYNASPSSLQNTSCGKIVMAAGTYTGNGTTTNTGLIQMPNAYDFANTGTFTNNGVVKANSISSITNNKIALSNNICPIMAIGATNDYVVDGIYTDATATTSAGTYTLASNTFVPIGLLPTGSQTLYAKFSRATCLFIVPFTYNKQTAPTGTAAQNFCTGETVSQIAVTGTGIIWYTAATGGTIVTGTTPIVAGTTYYASQTVSGCESMTRLAVTMSSGGCLGTNDFDTTAFHYYPNPTTDILYLKYSQELTSIKVTNLLGQNLMTKSINTTETQLDMSHLPTGTYLIEVAAGEATKVIKVIRK